ncbi:hypothetical protein QNH20_01450 [Neobacillus sp. WH10]|uniref:hypothetical protein n=1 Tax=Neobacillus sp. WH10 TaxID=3047873 RepID=UPI0024C135DD|nr:hypothetical protein [Neobacillus sp. WH10]WHY77872.1 hypothetical protein QNH20_01450 [Neobacillus sp. WH10]
MKNKFRELYLCSFAMIALGFFEIFFNYTETNTTEGSYSGILYLFVGALLLVFAITSHVKFNTNRKQLERELSKEYDERDDLIEGKAAHFTISILMIVTILMMFLSKWITIPTNTALMIIIVLTLITSTLAKKYYNHFL